MRIMTADFSPETTQANRQQKMCLTYKKQQNKTKQNKLSSRILDQGKISRYIKNEGEL